MSFAVSCLEGAKKGGDRDKEREWFCFTGQLLEGGKSIYLASGGSASASSRQIGWQKTCGPLVGRGHPGEHVSMPRSPTLVHSITSQPISQALES